MKLLILSPNQIQNRNWTHELFRQEFKKHHKTIYYGEGFPGYIKGKSIPEVIKDNNWDIDLILTYGLKYTEPFIGIGDINNIPKAHIAVDYFPTATSGTYERNKILFDRDKYDIYFGVVSHVVKNLEENGICKKAFLLPFSIDTNYYFKKSFEKINDVFAVFTTRTDTYPYREKIIRMVNDLKKVSSYTKKVQHENYIDMINKSKICITSNNKFKSLSIKYTEIMSCGSFLLADKPEDFDELGYINNKHLVLYDGIEDLKNKIFYYLRNPNEREIIEKEGMEFVRKYHNNSIRVKQFSDIISKELGIK